jgi:transcriptional regulator with XRE-family HTH domain
MYKPEEAKLFGAAIKQFLTERKLSQRQFAKQAGLDASYVSKLVNPKPGKEIAEPRQEIRQQLAKGLGLTEQELVEYIEQYRNFNVEKATAYIYNLSDLMSLATSMLEQLSFDEKFKMNITSQYTGYRLKNPGARAKSYLLVLDQGKEELGISIYRDIFTKYVLELKFYDDAWVNNEYGCEAKFQEFSRLYWVIPSKEDIFFEISQAYKDIFEGESIGSFYLDPKGIDPDDVIHKHLQGFKLKRSESGVVDWNFDHGDYFARLDHSDCCISIDKIDRFFPNTCKVYINSTEILEEFIGYFGEILMENY